MQRDTIGIVLAGGASRRMQATGDDTPVRKEMIAVAGVTLLERVVATVAAEVGEVFVVAAPGRPLPALPGGVRVVVDSTPGAGPLAGIRDALEAASAAAERSGRSPPAFAFVASCDVPLLTRSVVRNLLATARQTRALWTVPRVGGHLQVLVSVLEAGSKGRIADWLATGRRDPSGLVAALEAADPTFVHVVQEADLVAIDPGLGSFLDVDTPGDLARIREQLTYGKSDRDSYTPPA